jgi:3-dehydroquinate synthase
MRRLNVKSKSWNYQVLVGEGAWRELRRFPQARYSSTFVLSERRLWNRWGKLFLAHSGLKNVKALFVPAGEASKSLEWVERVAGQLLEHGADRRTLLITFGGGVVGDLGGFVASTYMRGIDYIQVPTTVVAQVDSAVGGKTGVNVGAMKNLVGTFHPPRLVLAEPLVLSSLSRRAFRSGLYEVVKHAILIGDPLFAVLEASLNSRSSYRQSRGKLTPHQVKRLEPILQNAVKVKVDVVNRDERETDWRQVLNLGHTFGHALEEATHYRRFLHGEAVAWGLLAATHLARRVGLLRSAGEEGSDAQRIIRLVRAVGPLPPVRDIKPRRILELLPHDKKAIGGRIRWVLPERIGKVKITADVPSADVAAAFREVQKIEPSGD